MTFDTVKAALRFYEDQEMSIKQMVMRGSRLVDWTLPTEVRCGRVARAACRFVMV